MAFQDYWNEEWKQIIFAGINEKEIYQLSNYGRVRIYKPATEEWKILKSANVKGYRYFTFKSNIDWKHKITKPLHRLVAELFCEQPSAEHKFVIHVNYVKDNNYSKNLKWVTQKELTAHNLKNPKVVKSRKKGVITNSKLTETQVIRLKMKLKRSKNPLYKIAKEFGITHTQLNRIRSGENWGHVKVG
ncbi:MAG: NUMOD4 domain-containing protein [Bacteroidota bacterium]|nr:NUMOD4 domain-containing protein [Bacteroidota bacterium]